MPRLFLLLLLAGLPGYSADTADIYWIDVEGGASTLIVTQAGESVLMDAGYEGERDAARVERVAREEAGLDHIDYFLTSHFHGDHVGGLGDLAERIEIRRFIDHGDSVDKDAERGGPLWRRYLAVAGDRRRTVAPGESLELKGAELLIVASDSREITSPLLGGEANPLCKTFEVKPEDKGENGKSLGYRFKIGDFVFVNLGDLSWNGQYRLACPVNLLGEADLFQATHHGVRDDVLPQQMWAMAPAVAVMNNGPTKGAGPQAVENVLGSPGLEDFWQLHRAVNNDAAHNAQERLTANLGPIEDCEGNWIHARVHGDGSFTVTNSRNGYSKKYSGKSDTGK